MLVRRKSTIPVRKSAKCHGNITPRGRGYSEIREIVDYVEKSVELVDEINDYIADLILVFVF